jgi:hypothetical protein
MHDPRWLNPGREMSLVAAMQEALTGWGQRLVASHEIPADIVAVVSKAPRIADLRPTAESS